MAFPTNTIFLGMRSSEDFAPDSARPTSYREMILYMFPNGDMPLTGLMSKMSSESVDDPKFTFYQQALPNQRGAITGKYTNSTLATPYTGSAAAANSQLFLKMAAADVQHFRKGHQILIRDASDFDVDKNAEVIMEPVSNGVNSFLTCQLIEADSSTDAGNSLANADVALVIGNINAEGAPRPQAIAYDPNELWNVTQIFRTPMEITRTAKNTKLRTPEAKARAKKEALQLHGIEMEKAFIFGQRSQRTDPSTGNFKRSTRGIISSIRAESGAIVKNFALDSDYNGASWLEGGEDFLNNRLRQIFRYGSKRKVAFSGDVGLAAINQLVLNKGTFNFTAQTAAYGIQITTWVTPFGTLDIITHPLFTYESSNERTMVIYDPTMLKYRYLQNSDTNYYEYTSTKGQQGEIGYDADLGEFLTEAGLEFHHPITGGILYGLGLNNQQGQSANF